MTNRDALALASGDTPARRAADERVAAVAEAEGFDDSVDALKLFGSAWRAR
jgi:hypothetical protein